LVEELTNGELANWKTQEMLKNAIWLFAGTIVVLIFFLPSYSKLQDLRQRNHDYEQKISELKDNQVKLIEEQRLLEQDPVYFEKVGREKMGLIREGEVVYKLVPGNEVKEK
jgi:cell division protein FtsB